MTTPVPHRPRLGQKIVIAMLLLAVLCLADVPASRATRRQPPRSSSGIKAPYEGYRAAGYPAISTPHKSMALSFITSGVVREIPVQEGDFVEPGDLLVQLNDEVQRLTVKAQSLAAQDNSDIQAAEHRLEMAQFDLGNLRQAAERESAGPREVKRAEIEVAIKTADEQAVKGRQQRSQILLAREEAILRDMSIRSSIHGIVARVQVEQGQAVDALQPVIHIVSIDPLLMDVAVPVRLGLTLQTAHVAIIRWRDVDQETPVEGRIKFITPVADARSNMLIVRLEIDNPLGLPAGLHAFVQFPEAEEILLQAMK